MRHSMILVIFSIPPPHCSSKFQPCQCGFFCVPSQLPPTSSTLYPCSSILKPLSLFIFLEFLNAWFYLMNVPFSSSEKLSISTLADPSKRVHHEAYLVCYENSFTIWHVMSKLYTDDVSGRESSKQTPDSLSPSFLFPSETGMTPSTPLSFLQVSEKN